MLLEILENICKQPYILEPKPVNRGNDSTHMSSHEHAKFNHREKFLMQVMDLLSFKATGEVHLTDDTRFR